MCNIRPSVMSTEPTCDCSMAGYQRYVRTRCYCIFSIPKGLVMIKLHSRGEGEDDDRENDCFRLAQLTRLKALYDSGESKYCTYCESCAQNAQQVLRGGHAVRARSRVLISM